MNDEIGNFLIKFTTEGFDKVEKSLDKLNQNMDKLNESFEKGSRKGESFFGALLKWDITVGTITKSFQALKREIASVFDTAKDMTTLFRAEENMGIEAKVLERWGLVAEAFDGSRGDALSFFQNVNELMRKASTPAEWGEGDAKGLALAGIHWAYDFSKNDVQNRDAYLVALRQAFMDAESDPKHKTSLKERLRKYVGQESLFSLFGSDESTFSNAMAWADQWRVFSKHPEKLQAAQDLKVTRIEWKQIKEELDLAFADPLNKILKGLEPLKEPLLRLANKLGDWAERHADDLAQWVEKGANWIITNFPEYWAKFVEFIGKLSEVVANIYDWLSNKGVIGKTWDSFKMMFDTAKLGVKAVAAAVSGNNDSLDNAINEYVDKYDKEGAGGYLGDMSRGLADIMSPKSPVIYRSPQYPVNVYQGDTVTVEAGYHDKTVINPKNAPIKGAMLSAMFH